MPIDSQHPDYENQIDKVLKVRHCYEGPDAIKAEGDTYLPMLDGQSPEEYEGYLTRAYFLAVVKPTVTAFVGAIMRKDPALELPTALEYMKDDTNGKGRDIGLLASMVIQELNQSGRSCILVEHNGDRPVLYHYPFESVINWSSDYVILKQSYEKVGDDPYEIETADEYLELTFDENGKYIQNIWREDNKGKFGIVETLTPVKRGEALDYIPFSVCNTTELGWSATNPAMLEISDINLDHYRLATDLRHGLHWTALPTMFLFGSFKDDEGNNLEIKVGAGSANVVPDTEARAELLEFTGAGLSSISAEMDADVVAMASIGAKMLQDNSHGVKAAETARIESSGDSATLSTMANACEAQLNQVLLWVADWEGLTGDVSIKLNRDFLDTTLDATMLTSLMQTYLGGGMSLDTFLYNLQRGEVLPKNTTIEDEKDKIAEGDGGGLNLDAE